MPINSKYLAPFITGEHYHVYNRAPSGKKMFPEERHFYFFLNLMKKHLLSYVNFYTYCLIPNHFHLFISVLDFESGKENDVNKIVTNQFRKLFIAYASALNKEYGTHGGYFSTPFRRILIDSEEYFSQIIFYIHCNAIHHNICLHPSQYRFSSYNSILSLKPTFLQRHQVLNWFGGIDQFIRDHEIMNSTYLDSPFYIE